MKTPTSKRLSLVLAQVFTILAAAPLIALESAYSPTEYNVKAAYLYNFTKFIEWPEPPPSGVFCVGVFGENPFGEELQSMLAGKTVQDKPLSVRHLKNAAEAAECQVVFVSHGEEERAGEVLSELKTAPVLTVGESPEFIQKGGIVRFQRVRNTVRFSINLDAAKEAKLKISSQLLKVAYSVLGAPETDE